MPPQQDKITIHGPKEDGTLRRGVQDNGRRVAGDLSAEALFFPWTWTLP
jgi:hypothetical protein